MSALVVMSGLPAVGKTTSARALAPALPATYLRIDRIEAARGARGFPLEGDRGDTAYVLAIGWPATRFSSSKTRL